MTTKKKLTEETLSLTATEFYILLALFNKELHGYGILQEIKESGIGPEPGNTTLYRSIRNLETRGLVADAGEREDASKNGLPRRYYKITSYGKEIAQAETVRARQVTRYAEEKTRPDSVYPNKNTGMVPGAI